MPELPEVQNVILSLRKAIGSTIIDVFSSGKSLRLVIDKQKLALIKGTKIVDIKRKAKYILFMLDNKKLILAHLGMSGSFVLTKESKIDKHDHVVLYLSKDLVLKYNDPRRFGLFIIFDKDDYLRSPYYLDYAIDAIDNNFNLDYFYPKLKKLKGSIKSALLNQRLVAGIGNIYACEILFSAKINPLRQAGSLTIEEVAEIITHSKNILRKAIEQGGSTLKDYRKADGSKGEFQNSFLVYGKDKQECSNIECKVILQRVVQSGRSTFYCNNCQK